MINSQIIKCVENINGFRINRNLHLKVIEAKLYWTPKQKTKHLLIQSTVYPSKYKKEDQLSLFKNDKQ